MLQLQDDRQSVSSDSNKKAKNNKGVFGIGKSTIDNRVRKDKKFKLVYQGNELTKEQQEFFKDTNVLRLYDINKFKEIKKEEPVGRSVAYAGPSNSNVTQKEKVFKKTDKKYKLDSQGNELTEKQQEFFKDSKVRDENGNLQVVYHSTTIYFTIFGETKDKAIHFFNY